MTLFVSGRKLMKYWKWLWWHTWLPDRYYYGIWFMFVSQLDIVIEADYFRLCFFPSKILVSVTSNFSIYCCVVRIMIGLRGVFSHPRVTKFWGGDTLRKRTTPKFKFEKLADIVKQIVYIGAIDPAEFKSGLILRLGLLLHCHIGSFCRKILKFFKN